MKQAPFVARHEAEWAALEQWLQTRADNARKARTTPNRGSLGDEDVPERYRRACQHLALARRRGYSPQLTARLQRLVQSGHDVMYRTPPPRWRRGVEFLLAGFPRLVRQERACMAVAAALFVLPLVTMFVLLQWRPGLADQLYSPAQMASFERMYDPADPKQALGRESGTNVQMFGHYIMNNISIGLQSFAGGLPAGLLTVRVLVANGVQIGGVAGHLQAIGNGGPFWRFVAGHSPFELTAIVISGGAGLRLGLAVVAPGRRRRRDALVEAGRTGAGISLGVTLMLLIAAFIEAFWSSNGALPSWLKFGVAGVLWLLVAAWLGLGGRGTIGAAPVDRSLRRDPANALAAGPGPDPATARATGASMGAATAAATAPAATR